ncbi:hypothetical protein [Bradymonas sediminis]|uniref:Uncharacterized protein n=1 Tax=Bradymonas sediminis TaxID=1548548 RepID=A0A2Z4FNI7_9DELT|nr:hypothetical protein [Bradymonas sediminis]AWV90420.1 hypothetical protein DN745_14215 [Bradymonas sediminis]TDP72194.1 hypothetical protein DFR33_107176 [Bradymonas sediminis]
MKMIYCKQLIILLICAVGLSATGCYTYEAVKPTELPKLNGSYEKTVGSTYNPNNTSTPIVERSVVHLERVDGRMVEISGPMDARVTRKSGEAIVIEHPIVARTNAVSLFVKGGNIAEQEFLLQDIEKVEVEKLQGTRTGLAVLMLTLGVAAITMGVVSTTRE